MFIPKGAEIFTTYIWPHLSTRQRRRSLSQGWHFSCTCPRCSDPAEMGALTSAILCKTCQSSEGYFLHENPLQDQSVEEQIWKCHHCEILGNSKELNTLVDDLQAKLDKIARNDIEGNLELLKCARKVLHVNHSILTEIRARMIPIICRQGTKQIYHFPQEIIALKRQMCKENLAVLNVTCPGLSLQRGGLLFELQESEFFIAKLKYENDEMSDEDFYDKVKQCKLLLLECGQCLNNERPNSIEYFYEKSAMVALQTYIEMLSDI